MWLEIQTPKHFQDLFDRFDDFHDAVLREFYFCGPTCRHEGGVSFGSKEFLKLFFQGGRGEVPALEFLCLRLHRLSLEDVDSLRSDAIDHASFSFQDNLIYWSSTEGFTPGSSQNCGLWLACERLFWRPIPDGIGRRLRLGNQNEYDPFLESLLEP